ncbi:NADP-dependent oxidoreductase [Streptomyces sp. NPDC051662]|uniref:MDR family NADP-dependent oxidoreductase n=1 Tax=Streptomyces sp. NPDC051662 TaxID=3154750 RepID=UPI00341AA9BC
MNATPAPANPVSVPATHHEVQLAARPEGPLTVDHFRLTEAPVPVPGPGQVLVRNRLMSVTAVMRTLMRDDVELPMPSYAPGEALWGPAIGEVISAPANGPRPGDLVAHRLGWREYAVLDAAGAEPLDLDALPDPVAHLSQGFTAWLGVVRAAEVRPGDTVFVSGAAGGVGSLAGQFARLHGAGRVIGSTSTRRKATHLVDELGYDAVVLRTEGGIEDQLRAVAPEGLDAVFDNVGGEQLRAAVALARRGARIALVGGLSGQVGGESGALVEMDTLALISRGITLRGIAAADHLDALPEWREEFGRALREGTVTVPHTTLPGIGQAPRALCELLAGRHIGAVLVEL